METLLLSLKTESPYLQLFYILFCSGLSFFLSKKLKNLSFFSKLANESKKKNLFVHANTFLICFSLTLIYGFLIYRRYFGYGSYLTLLLFLLMSLIPFYLLIFLLSTELSIDKKVRKLFLAFFGLIIMLYPTGVFHYVGEFVEDYTLFFFGHNRSLVRILTDVYSLIFFIYVIRYISLRYKEHLKVLNHLKSLSKLLNYRLVMSGIYSLAVVVWMFITGVPIPLLKWILGFLVSVVSFSMRKIIWEFISGILILSKRLVRIGDWVSLEMGAKSGTVTKLCLTYVLIEEKEGKELLIPNSELISSNLERKKLAENS